MMSSSSASSLPIDLWQVVLQFVPELYLSRKTAILSKALLRLTRRECRQRRRREGVDFQEHKNAIAEARIEWQKIRDRLSAAVRARLDESLFDTLQCLLIEEDGGNHNIAKAIDLIELGASSNALPTHVYAPESRVNFTYLVNVLASTSTGSLDYSMLFTLIAHLTLAGSTWTHSTLASTPALELAINAFVSSRGSRHLRLVEMLALAGAQISSSGGWKDWISCLNSDRKCTTNERRFVRLATRFIAFDAPALFGRRNWCPYFWNVFGAEPRRDLLLEMVASFEDGLQSTAAANGGFDAFFKRLLDDGDGQSLQTLLTWSIATKSRREIVVYLLKNTPWLRSLILEHVPELVFMLSLQYPALKAFQVLIKAESAAIATVESPSKPRVNLLQYVSDSDFIMDGDDIVSNDIKVTAHLKRVLQCLMRHCVFENANDHEKSKPFGIIGIGDHMIFPTVRDRGMTVQA